MGTMGFAFVIGLVVFWKKAHNIVFGGGMEAYSDEGRLIQWQLAWPHILANPVTGHGYATAGDVIGNFLGAGAAGIASVDSWLISTLVETGVPGFVFFFGMAIFAAWRGLRLFLFDPSKGAAAAGALACSLIAICRPEVRSRATGKLHDNLHHDRLYHFPRSLPCCADRNDAAPEQSRFRNGSAGHAAGHSAAPA